jgi:hypothetical protein
MLSSCRLVLAAAAISLVASPSVAYSHGGGLDKYGCHNNRKTGDYHCHRASAIAPSTPPPARQPAVPAGSQVAPSSGTSTAPGPSTAPAKAPDPYAKCKIIQDHRERLKCFDQASAGK